MHSPSVAIIVVNWNGYEFTKACMVSLSKVLYPNFKVILVDNASTDVQDKNLKDNFKEVIYLQNTENLGFTGGNNRGIKYAIENNFEYIMLLNNDTEVEADFLDMLIDKISILPQVGAIQPKMLFMHDKSRIWNAGGIYFSLLGWPKTIGENVKDKARYNKPKEVDWITGCCFLVKASVVKRVGMLNERYFIYFEDVDWSFRIKSSGYKLYYEPAAVIYHHAGMSNKRKSKGKEGYLSPFVHYLNIRNNIWLLKQHVPPYLYFSVFIFHFIKFFTYLAYFATRGRFTKLRFGFRGLKDGLLKKAH
jgi:GT2 family glycosyltransferase